jgi:hypothetical protein
MNRLLLMVLFAVGSLALFPSGTTGAPACNDCTCRGMLYWYDYSNTSTYGLRVPVKGNPGMTVAVRQGLEGGVVNGPAYSANCDQGNGVQDTSTLYQRYLYTSAWTAVCQVPNPPGQNARVEVTPADPTANQLAPGWTGEYRVTCVVANNNNN